MKKTLYLILAAIFLSSSVKAQINKILKQGNVFQKDFKTTIPFTYINGWIIIEVEIQNKTYNFLLDTGSSNLITNEFAQELNLNPLGTEDIKDINKKSNSTKYTRINNIKIKDIDFQKTIAAIVDLNAITEIKCTKIDGIIGSNLMRKAVWDFDFKNQLITITSDEKKLHLPSKTISSKLYIGTAGIPSVTININGQKILNNTVDFGNSGSNLLRADYFKKQIKNKKIKQIVKGYGKNFGAFGRSDIEEFHHIIIDEMRIGNHTIKNLFATVNKESGNNLGLDFFKNYRVILNWKTKKIKLIEKDIAGNDSFISYGFSTLYEKKGIYVNSIIESSNASKLIKNGDKILQIENQNYINITEEKYCEIFENILDLKNDFLEIKVERNGKKLDFKILKTKLL
ncbi:aspartyl protease family protein [Aquimarina agarivorans]|uniref:aspartyl protease family protein n=1 Tax=Aquimarina agarivorans TaxID=980584 RepID=UPI000248E672|nr:aspartyl protease family protein [Aquimarina agarivorans]